MSALWPSRQKDHPGVGTQSPQDVLRGNTGVEWGAAWTQQHSKRQGQDVTRSPRDMWQPLGPPKPEK